MGKTTLYHPVSLYTIRGAAQWGGFKLGEIRQLDADEEALTAYYAVELKDLPKDVANKRVERVREALQNCFQADVAIIAITYNSNRGYNVTIKVDLNAGNVALPDGETPINGGE